ncbi:MAG: tRNA lysidine(34) synthetase TilS [Desulfobacterales bacterium]|nr:tRNA lysidine(34) synthetase TilS [Desulfobacterales bacterium]
MPPSPNGSSNFDIQRKVRRKVLRTLADADLIPPNSAVLVGVSGGADSVALLLLLHDLVAGSGTTLAVAHLDHGLRPEAGLLEATFVLGLARKMNLPCHIRRADVATAAKAHGQGIEEAGRQHRYQFFNDLRRVAGYDRVALGHHSDDNAEQVLLNLLRGSGPHGLAGIAPRRDDGIVRPLIRLQRTDLVAYLDARGVTYLNDPSNSDLHHRRNRIRHELLPHLADTYNPKVVPALNRLAGILREEQDWMEGLAGALLESCTVSRDPESISLNTTQLEQYHPAAQRRVIRNALARVKGDLLRFGHTHVLAVINLMQTPAGRGRLDLPGRIRATCRGRVLRLEKHSRPLRETPGAPILSAGPSPFHFSVPSLPTPGGTPVRVPLAPLGHQIVFSILTPGPKPPWHNAGQAVVFFDMDALSLPITVRNWQPGDRFTPLGMKERLGIDRFLANRNVPKPERLFVPVLEAGGKIIWVVGHRMDDTVKVRPSTRWVLKAEFALA